MSGSFAVPYWRKKVQDLTCEWNNPQPNDERAAVLDRFKLARSRKYCFISERNLVSAEIRKFALCLDPSGRGIPKWQFLSWGSPVEIRAQPYKST